MQQVGKPHLPTQLTKHLSELCAPTRDERTVALTALIIGT